MRNTLKESSNRRANCPMSTVIHHFRETGRTIVFAAATDSAATTDTTLQLAEVATAAFWIVDLINFSRFIGMIKLYLTGFIFMCFCFICSCSSKGLIIRMFLQTHGHYIVLFE